MNKTMIEDYFKTSDIGKPLNDLINGPINSLIGVTDKAKTALERIGITSIFDLAFSEVFRHAELISSETDSVFQKTNQVPSNLFDENATSNVEFDQIKELDIKTLRAIDDATATAIKSALAISNLRELSLWPPYMAAKEIVNSQYGLGFSSGSDPEAPQDLVPKTGEYPVEVIYYNTHVLAKAPEVNQPVPLEQHGPVEINFGGKVGGNESYFEKPGWGAILNYSQKWFAEGITLGSLIKCVPLGPGETTKIAVIDWQRTTSGSTTEDLTQTERLTNEMQQKRSINEIADATATELQSGTSGTAAVSSSSSAGVAAGGVIPGLPGLFGATASNSTNVTGSGSFSTSSGKKDVSSSLQQNIDNSTHQHSFSARNKRASVVTELSETQSETISTRSLTNYNHMHALTLQYWQVVQIFRTEVKLEKYQRLLYIPMQPFDFTNNENLITKFKTILIRAAHSDYLRSLLFASVGNVSFEIVARNPGEAVDTSVDPSLPRSEQDREAREKARAKAIAIAKVIAREKMVLNIFQREGIVFDYDSGRRSWKMPGTFQLVNVKWTSDQSPQIRTVVINVENGPDILVNSNGPSFNSNDVNPDFNGTIPLGSIEGISVVLQSASDEHTTHKLDLKYDVGGGIFKTMRVELMVSKNRESAEVLNVTPPQRSGELSAALNEQALYYSQQIWLNLDVHYLTLMLSKFTYKGKRIVEYIDPKPTSVAGNCLGFIWNDADEQTDQEWKQWVEAQIDRDKVTYQRIALPTDGVFAEAVLGRFNSAEKLDLTRFWNWQDSPIPFSAPDIAALQSGQQQVSAAPSIGGLESPVVNIMNPAPLPDPTGMQAVNNSLATNMFRDMSGLAQSSALAQAALNASSQGATAAGTQAGANMATFANYQVEMAKILASLAPMLMGLPPAPLTGGKNITNAGAALNAAQSIDGGGSASDGSTGAVSSNGGGSSSSTSGGGQTGSSGNTAAGSRGATGDAMDMITGGSTLRGVPVDLIRDMITGQTPSPTSSTASTEFVKIVGDPLSASSQSIDLAELLANHIKRRTAVPESGGICVDACYQYLIDALKEIDVEILHLRDERFKHGYPHIVTHNGGTLPGLIFIRIYYSNATNMDWVNLPEPFRGRGPIGALLYGDLISGRTRGITTSQDKWPVNMVPGTLLQLWQDQPNFESVRDTGDTKELFSMGHAPIFLGYKNDDPATNTIIVADQHHLTTEYTYPYAGLRYVIAAKPSKIQLVKV